MKLFASYILSAILGLWVSTLMIPQVIVNVQKTSNFLGIQLTEQWQIFLLLGAIIGFLNFFVKPILDTITLPLRIVSLGLFGFLINMGLIFLVDYMFLELRAPWFWSLFWITLIIWLFNISLHKLIFNKTNS